MKPMNLKDLPEYIRSGANDESIVVDMGMIVEKPNWIKRIGLISSVCLLIAAGFFTYNASESITVVVGPDAKPEVIAAIINENGGSVVEIKDNTYRVRLSKFRNASLFLEKLRSNKIVKEAKIGQ